MDPHIVLGIDSDASVEIAKKAYTKLVKKYHPDMPNGNADKFKQINEAFEEFKNPPEVHPYIDANSENLHDIFKHMYEGSPEFRYKMPPRRVRLNITLEEAFYGATYDGCKFEPGLVDGAVIRDIKKSQYTQETEYHIYYTKHIKYEVFDNNLIETLDLSYLDCILGCTVQVSTICGKNLGINIPKFSSAKTKLKIPYKGMNNDLLRGHLFIQINPVMPTKLSAHEEELLLELKNETSK